MKLEIKNISKSYPGQKVFRNFSLAFRENAITCILGPSGCGKTTLLNILSGNMMPDSGSSEGFRNRTLSYIFQEPRLLPWKTVSENLLFPVKEIIDVASRQGWIEHYLQLVNLSGKGGLYPYQLSGGMKQRVSMARAFAFPSDVILMDEPFRALDLPLKNNLMQTFLGIWEEHRRTVIAVTHDIDEALYMGHEVIVFSQAPVKLLDRIIPASDKVTAGKPGKEELRKKIIRLLTDGGNSGQEA